MAFIRSGGFRILLAAVVVLSFVSGAAAVGFYLGFLRNLPDLHRVEDFRPALSSVVMEKPGREFWGSQTTVPSALIS